jgi:hypothetical protein
MDMEQMMERLLARMDAMAPTGERESHREREREKEEKFLMMAIHLDVLAPYHGAARDEQP